MSEEQLIKNRLDDIYNNKKYKGIDLEDNMKFAIFSDLHLGDGKKADNFVHNEETMLLALKYYKKNKFSIILLGDIEEFWQFDYIEIRQKYDKTIYKIFQDDKKIKVYRVFGNHDLEWKGFQDPVGSDGYSYQGVPEAYLLGGRILMLHGNQGDQFADKKAWAGRYWTRMFRKVEPLIRKLGYENYEATKSQIPKDRERILYDWAKSKKLILICGHTHRAIFASRNYYFWLKKEIIQNLSNILLKFKPKESKTELLKKLYNSVIKLLKEKFRGRDINILEPNGEPLPCYFNTGSGLFRKGITNIEIEKGKIRLVKWKNDKNLKEKDRWENLWQEDLSLEDIIKSLVKQ